MTDQFSTTEFTTSPGTYLRCLLGMWFKRYGLWVAITVLVSAVLGVTYDLRFVIVTLMLVMIVMPMLLSYIYIYYMLAPEARRAIMPMRVEMHNDGSMTLTYMADAIDGKPPHAPETISAADIRGLHTWHSYRVVVMRAKRMSFMLIPMSAIIADSSQDM